MNSKKIFGCLGAIIGITVFVLGLVYFIKSFYTYDGGFEADMDFVILMLVGIAFTFYGVFTFIKSNDESYNLVKATIYLLVASGLILAAYSFGGLFKSLAKDEGFLAYNFTFGMIGLIILGTGIFLYFYNKNKNSNNEAA